MSVRASGSWESRSKLFSDSGSFPGTPPSTTLQPRKLSPRWGRGSPCSPSRSHETQKKPCPCHTAGRQGQLLSSVLSRTLSYKYRDLDTPYSGLGASDDPAELSTQLSAPGVLKVFGDSVCSGTHYKSVLATGTSSARELVREALERYALSPERAAQFVLCDVVGKFSPDI